MTTEIGQGDMPAEDHLATLFDEDRSVELFAIHSVFAATEHGQNLAEEVRYARYNIASVPNEEWTRLLGADVNNLTHMPLTYGLTRSFIRTTEQAEPGYFSQEDKTLLQVAALIHDQGEALVGDISFGDKTDEDEVEERRMFETNQEAFSQGITPEVQQLIIRARDEIVFNPTSRLGSAFNAVERAGYMRTALRASEHLYNGTAGASAESMQWIVADVCLNQTLKLLEYTATYPAIKQYLHSQRAKISAAFALVTPEIFANYGPDAAAKSIQFRAAQAAWLP